MKTTHQNNQAAFYQDQAERYDQLYAHRSRTYALKANFAKEVITAKGLTSGTLLEVGCGSGLFTQKYDIICGVDIIHHIENPIEALRVWKNLANPNGILLFLECNPINPAMYIRHYNRPEEKRLYLNNKKNLTSWVAAAGWKNISVKNLPTYLPSGPEKMWNLLTVTEEFIHKIPLINRLSGLFLVYAEKNIK